jgi:putative tricarboxylic transport membrane protein
LRRIAQGDVTTLVQSPVAAGLLLLAALALIVPIILRARQGRGPGTDGRDED